MNRRTVFRGVYAFERIDDALPFMPLSARRALDALGFKLSLEGWLSLSLDDRRSLVLAGTEEHVDSRAQDLLGRAAPAPCRIPVQPEPEALGPPAALLAALGSARPLDALRWRALAGLDRYALAKCMHDEQKLARAYDGIVGAGAALTHVNSAGEARMVDVGHKAETRRRAVASARVSTTRDAIAAVAAGAVSKGDVLAAARMAGILASKRTAELIPLCHPVRTTRAEIEFELDADRGQLSVKATIEAVDRTGVEMEAMVAATVACLTVYDMIKSVDRWATLDAVRLDCKEGGKSGRVARPADRGGP